MTEPCLKSIRKKSKICLGVRIHLLICSTKYWCNPQMDSTGPIHTATYWNFPFYLSAAVLGILFAQVSPMPPEATCSFWRIPIALLVVLRIWTILFWRQAISRLDCKGLPCTMANTLVTRVQAAQTS